jgi:hypothetical protein
MELYNFDQPITELDIDVPAWVAQDITGADVAAICEGGCASGAYMPAVTYHQAAQTMSEHGDDVLQFIEDSLGELPAPPDSVSWSGLAVHYLSCAVELWAASIVDEAAQELADRAA